MMEPAGEQKLSCGFIFEETEVTYDAKKLEALADENLKLIKWFIDHDSETAQDMKKMGELRTALEAALGDAEKELFQELKDVSDGVNMNYATERFITGFRLGVLLMTEVFAGSDSLILH